MQIKITEEFLRKRSFTHRYDHLLEVYWTLENITHPEYPNNDTIYTIRHKDIVEEVTRDEIALISRGDYVS